jgi:Secretion system C-terminal sorting domain
MKTKFHFIIAVWLISYASNAGAQVPVLSSNLSAAATLFLDFDGHTVSGTAWNSTDALICAGSGLTTAQVNEVFDRVSEDYRPFNINITTDSTIFLKAPLNQRTRVIITTTSDWYPGVGGISFIGSFVWGDDTPCFVFSAALSYKPKKVAEAVSHEAGHTLSLYHQAVYDQNCTLVSSYNSGTGVGEIGWAPIMGVGYSKNFTLWNNGPNPYGCNQIQNDLDVITANNGFSYRNDDYSNTFTNADNNTFVNNQFIVNGIIERNTDKDVFQFTIPAAGRFKLDAIPYNVGAGNAGSDLDMQVTLYSSDQTLLNIYNPGNTLSLLVDTILNEGVYYAKVEGKGNEYAPAYASLGSYSLQGSFTDQSSPLPLRKLELKGVQTGNKHQLSWIIDADEKIITQSLEISTNGKDFSTLVQTSADSRSYIYIPSTSAPVLYRLNVIFDNGRQNFSNTISMRQLSEQTFKPQLNGNIIYDSYLNVSSKGNYNFRIMDLTGKTIAAGQVTSGSNSINTLTAASGMYLINFTNGSEQWTEKFVRQ